MRRVTPKALCIVLLIGTTCYGQSLADAARENRKQNSDKGATSRKVVTDDDLSLKPEVIKLVPGTTANGQGSVVAPGRGKHNYRVVMLDASRFTNGGTIHITITMGSGDSEASFDLYPENLPLPTEGMPNSLAEARNIRSSSGAKLSYRFTHGAVFQFGAEGSWNSKAGATNTYSYVIEVDSAQ